MLSVPMTRVLFVDDEPRVLEALQRSLRPYRSRLQVAAATSGAKALEMLGGDAYDVIVSDMRMPGMDGAALLAQVQERYPSLVRVALSGQTDLEARMRAVRTAHQFLGKPCDTTCLIDAIDQARRVQVQVQSRDVLAVIGSTASLPCVPEVLAELCVALGEEEADVGRIAAIVERDIGMVAKLMQLVNSPFFGLRRRPSSTQDAVTALGVSLLKSLVVTFGIFEVAPNASESTRTVAAEIHANAIQTAALAQRIARKEARDAALTAGLLHDIGHLAWLYRMPETFAKVRTVQAATGRPQSAVEQELCGFTHGDIGSLLAGLWGYPVDVVEAIRLHHDAPAAGHSRLELSDIIYIAHELSAPEGGEIPDEYVERLGVARELASWREWAAELAGTVA